MHKNIFTSARFAMVLLGIGCFISCAGSPAGRDGAGGAGDGSSGGGDGGKSGSGGSAGKGGASGAGPGANGGNAAGGSAAGGSVGSGGGAGSGAGGSGGGASAGSGGSAAGGSGNSVGGSGGAGGQAGGAGSAPPPIEGPGVFFSGKEMTLTKMVAGDAMPGYVSGGATVIPVTDPVLNGLGVKYAFDVNVMGTGMTLFQWDWRMDVVDPVSTKPFKWNYFDAGAFAGISFWAKTETSRIFFSFTSYDSMSIGTSESSTTACTKPSRAECGPAYVKSAIVNTTWSRVVLPFATFNPPMANQKPLGRVDMWTAGPFHMSITGITFVTAAQL